MEKYIRKNVEVEKTTLFKKAKHSSLADIVSFVNPTQARQSARILKDLFKKAKTRERKVRILRATVLASNRALASSKRKNLSAKEKRQLREIARIYANAYSHMKL